MRKINKEFKELFEKTCWEACYRGTTSKVGSSGRIKAKQNRSIGVTLLANGFLQVSYKFHGNEVASYNAKDNRLQLTACGYGTSPSTKELLNSLCPSGYGFFSKNFEGYVAIIDNVFKQGYIVIYDYIR